MAFDLRKQTNEEPAGKKPYWIYVLIAVLLIGGAAWWFNQPKEQAAALARKAPVAVAVKDTLPAVTKDTTSAVALAPVDTAVIAASFEAGSTAPRTSMVTLAKLKRWTGKINVFGYASSEGGPALNQSISQARADAYKKVLVRSGVADSLVTAQGKGIDNPIASNDTEKGRRKNRRVEVQIQN